MDNTIPPALSPVSKKNLFTPLLLIGIPCTIGLTMALSFIVLRYTYGGPGMGYLIFPFVILIMAGLANVVLAAVLALGFGSKMSRRTAIITLVILNLVTLTIYGGVVVTDYLTKSAAAKKVESKQARELYLADHASDVTQCDEITVNFSYWQRCLDTSRSQPNQTRNLEERLAICLQQAQQKHFSSQPEALTKTCQDRFSGTP